VAYLTKVSGPMAALKPVAWPPFVTASKWATVWQNLVDRANRVRGKFKAPWVDPATGETDMVWSARLTNGDAVRLIMGWREAIGDNTRQKAIWPLWPQFAGVAYGWDPKQPERLKVTKAQEQAPYPTEMLAELWDALYRVALDLDDGEPNPRVDLDGMFSDVVFQAEVKRDLSTDGTMRTFEKRIPLICKNKDGSAGAPKCKTKMKTWPYLCTEYEKCEWHGPDIDPTTGLRKSGETLFRMALLVLIGVILFDNQPRRSRRSRE
jgi:hypothetical protein